jgi:hypothetical protein
MNNIDNIMQALISLIDYVENRNDEMTEDDDVKAQEECGYYLQNMSNAERNSFLDYLKKSNRLELAEQFGIT